VIRNTPFGRKTGTANLVGLFASVLIAVFLAGLGVGIFIAIILGFVSGLVLSFLLFRSEMEEE